MCGSFFLIKLQAWIIESLLYVIIRVSCCVNFRNHTKSILKLHDDLKFDLLIRKHITYAMYTKSMATCLGY